MNSGNTDRALKARLGIAGFDDILLGGLARHRLFLVEGSPGTGKTTMALQFLIEGATQGERGLYITLSETEEELRETAASHGWPLDSNIDIFELAPPESLLDVDQQQSLLYSSDLELGETTKRVFAAIDKSKPTRVVLDSLSEIRLLAESSLRYRRQVLALKHYFAKQNVTVLLLDDMTADVGDRTVHSIAHGVIRLEQLSPEYGAERRRARVVKYRGQSFRGGFHDYAIRQGGIELFPRLVSADHRTDLPTTILSTGVNAFDSLIGGGIESGSSTLIVGPSGTGKTTVCFQFVKAAVARGERAAIFVFDEEINLLISRNKALGIDLAGMAERGEIIIEAIDAAEVSPGEFAHKVRYCVRDNGVKTVIIDSLNGYQNAMPQENFLVLHMHELIQFLNRQGVATFLTVAQKGVIGDMQSPVDVTYLADTVVLLRYFEWHGDVRRAISIVKKRTGAHETTIREMHIADGGIRVGEPLREFQGVLRGVPVYRSEMSTPDITIS